MNATVRHSLRLVTALVLALLVACGSDEPEDTCCAPPVPTQALPTPPPGTPVANVMPTPTTEQVILMSAFARMQQLPYSLCPPGANQSACVSLVNTPVTFNVPGKGMVTYVRVPQDFTRGIAFVQFAGSPGMGPEVQALGRDPSGAWKLFLLARGATPPPWLVQLPGDAVACSYNIMPARLLAEPSMTSNGPMLRDGDKLRLEEFRIEQEGIVTPGRGFYRVSAPAAGWVYSDFVANALWDACPSIR